MLGVAVGRLGPRLGLRGGTGSALADDGAGALPRGFGPPRPLHLTVHALRGVVPAEPSQGQGAAGRRSEAERERREAESPSLGTGRRPSPLLRSRDRGESTLLEGGLPDGGLLAAAGEGGADESCGGTGLEAVEVEAGQGGRAAGARARRGEASPALVTGRRASPPVRSREQRSGEEEGASSAQRGWLEGEGDGLTAEEQALSAAPAVAGRLRAADGGLRLEGESPALVMGTRVSPPVRSRERHGEGDAGGRVAVSPARGLWSGGRLVAAREAGWAKEASLGELPRALWLQREVAEKRRRERSTAAASPSSSAGRAKRAGSARAGHWHEAMSPMSTASSQVEDAAAGHPSARDAAALSPMAWSTPSDMRSEDGGEGASPVREVDLGSTSAVAAPEWVDADVVCWNSQALKAAAADLRVRKYEGSASRLKLSWLGEWVRVELPFVVVLLEVEGTNKEMASLRAWFARVGYRMSWVPGEGGEARSGKQLGAHANGVAVAVRLAAGKLVAIKRLAERAVGFSVRRKLVARVLHGGAVHGLHGVQRSEDDLPGEPPARSFAAQLRALQDWLQSQGGGLLFGDFNWVPCLSWRQPRPAGRLQPNGVALQTAMGWRCKCCSQGVGEESRGG